VTRTVANLATHVNSYSKFSYLSMINLKNFNGCYQFRPASWILVEGEDTHEFLQSQFSNDLNKLQVAEHCYGLWLDQKGRVHGDSFVIRAEEEKFYLFSYATPEPLIIEKLGKYIVADDVDLRGITGEMAGLCVIGNAIELIPELSKIPGVCGKIERVEGSFWSFPGRRGNVDAVEIVGEKHALARLALTIEGKFGKSGILSASDMEFVRIISGIPGIPVDIGDKELPQEAGLEKDAVSFSKGCYLGQEVMSRLHSMGKARRSLRVLEGGKYYPPGEALYLENKKVGVLKSSVRMENTHFFLALVSNSVSEVASLTVSETADEILTPFSG
jgi:tRNA-modifying protein YgfZ